MDMRNESAFGNIFCIKTNDGHHIDGICSASGEKTCSPAIVVDGKMHKIKMNVTPGQDIPVNITIDRKKGTLCFSYNGKSTTVNAEIKDSKKANILFGKHTADNYYDVAPINVRDISIAIDGKEKYFWHLAAHEGDFCLDTKNGVKAQAINGNWIYDKHVKWAQVYSFQSSEGIQMAFDDKSDLFYIIGSKFVRQFDPATKKTKEIKTLGGYRVMAHSNYISYCDYDGTLLNYSIEKNAISKFNFQTSEWSYGTDLKAEPEHSNHAWAQYNDTIAYVFGGYGFYKFQNGLYRINLRSGKIEKVDYQPSIKPRTGCAAAIVDGKMYIFGGYGNEEGQQELPIRYYYELICIDLKTNIATTVWEAKGEQNTSFQLASEMVYDKENKVFYAATTHQDGRMIAISIDKPKWNIISDEINDRFEFRDMTFNLYKCEKSQKMYAVVNKCNNSKFTISIYSIDLPLQTDFSPSNNTSEKSGVSGWWYMLLLIPFAGVIAFWLSKRKKAQQSIIQEPASKDVPVEIPSVGIEEDIPMVTEKQKSTISLLGDFVVTDKEGEDITSQFSKRMRDLLTIIILHSQKNAKGIEMTEIDDSLWQNMNETSARNNRNVYISKLRVQAEKIGDINIINDKIHYFITFGDDVECDYISAMKCIDKIRRGNASNSTIEKALQLLFKGPLVPNMSYEWLDTFKAQYSESALEALGMLLKDAEEENNEELQLKIAESIIQHDPFNDKALAVQCCIYYRQGKKGLAKKVYDNFCRVYKNSMGEEYNIAFADICK